TLQNSFIEKSYNLKSVSVGLMWLIKNRIIFCSCKDKENRLFWISSFDLTTICCCTFLFFFFSMAYNPYFLSFHHILTCRFFRKPYQMSHEPYQMSHEVY